MNDRRPCVRTSRVVFNYFELYSIFLISVSLSPGAHMLRAANLDFPVEIVINRFSTFKHNSPVTPVRFVRFAQQTFVQRRYAELVAFSNDGGGEAVKNIPRVAYERIIINY